MDLNQVQAVDKVDSAAELMQSVVTKLEAKVQAREISNAERNAAIVRYAEELVSQIDPKEVPPNDFWKYGDLLRTTQRWPEAEDYLAKAVKFASTPDRKINDTLRLAQAQAKNGKVVEAIKSVESTFSAKDEETAPILLATLYEVVPAAENKGQNKELAKLLQGAIICHERTKVNLETDEGRIFNAAKRYHVGKAEAKAAELAASSN